MAQSGHQSLTSTKLRGRDFGCRSFQVVAGIWRVLCVPKPEMACLGKLSLPARIQLGRTVVGGWQFIPSKTCGNRIATQWKMVNVPKAGFVLSVEHV